MRVKRTAFATIFASLLSASVAAAFPITIPGITHKTPPPAPPPASPPVVQPPGVYLVYQSETDVFIVDATTIADSAEGRRTANVYVLDKAGAHRRDVDDFDCKGHFLHKTGGDEFTLQPNGADITVVKGFAWKADHIDPADSVIRQVENFVCQWPKPPRAHDLVRLSDLPDDEHARELKLGRSAAEFFR